MSNDVLDLDEFLERVQDDKELLVELLDIFVDDYKTKREQIGEAFSSNDYEQVKSIAHSLKGASGNISAKLLRELFIQCEEMGKNQDGSGHEEVLSQMDKQFEDLSARITSIKEEYNA